LKYDLEWFVSMAQKISHWNKYENWDGIWPCWKCECKMKMMRTESWQNVLWTAENVLKQQKNVLRIVWVKCVKTADECAETAEKCAENFVETADKCAETAEKCAEKCQDS